MDIDRSRQIVRLYLKALDRDKAERAALLDEACAGDNALRQEVESLLAHRDLHGDFIEAPALEVIAKAIADDTMPLLIGRNISHYKVLSLLGAGGMGQVYLSHDMRLDRTVALKILPPVIAADRGRMRRFILEARAASALNHPNVATIYDIDESDGIHFMVMECVEGQTLARRIGDQPLAAEEIVAIAIQVADALDAAHAVGITHRD